MKLRAGLAALAALLVAAAPAHARPGDPDASFGTGGEVLLKEPKGYVVLRALAEQPDGKLLAAGARVGGSSRGLVVRLDRAGRLDPAFGRGGVVQLAELVPLALVPQPDGRVVAWGRGGEPEEGFSRLVRLDRDGDVDPDFGRDGAGAGGAHPRLEPFGAFGTSDGGVVAVGREIPPEGGVRGVLVRFGPDGRVDRAFGQDGFATFALPGANGDFRFGVEQAGGGLVAGGPFVDHDSFGDMFTPPRFQWTLVRFTPAGEVDRSFGEEGVARDLLAGRYGDFTDLAAQPDGKLVAGGMAGFGDPDNTFGFAVARTNADGSRDASFGDGGLALLRAPASAPATAQEALVAPQASGGVVSVGRYLTDVGGLGVIGMGLGRLTGGGQPDPGFGSAGWSTAFGARFMKPQDVLGTSDGKIVVAADSPDCDDQAALLMRFHSEDAEAARPDAGPAVRTCSTTVVGEPDGDIPVEVQCPVVEDVCKGEQTLEATAARRLRIGARRFTVRGGATAIVRVRATRAARRLCARRSSVLARATFRARDGEGHRRTTRRALRIRC